MLIKICGLSTSETIAAAAAAGASHVGLVHFAASPRHLALDRAASLRATVPSGLKTVLLLVDASEEEIAHAVARVRPDIVQFHGKEPPGHVARMRGALGVEAWKALAVRDQASLESAREYAGAADRILFDAPPPSPDAALPGGNGEGFDWTLLAGHRHAAPWGLAGGLTPANARAAIAATGAPLVDVSSGVEKARGVKDVDKIAAFCKAARSL
ncbi:phosphoribosylanthranilate isomerase [Qipengyuania nanhaisediminis]|uniref:phosphoribosylanthranilate isomerase n=1 Tax=Qipengyuania nanhaisediminis TaxID=604088 RepID=UPI0038B2F3C2